MIVEFDVDSDILSHAVREVPGTTVRLEQLDAAEDVPLRNVFWAVGGCTETFEDALDADPTVRSWSKLFATGDTRLYRVEYAEGVPEIAAHDALVSLDGLISGAVNDGDGWTVRAQFPSREAIAEFCDRCWNAGFDLEIRAIYDQERRETDERYGLTDIQHETLVSAFELGYFTIPRDASLAEVADHLDISGQAASERLRRGMSALVESALLDAEREDAESSWLEVDDR